MKVKPARVLDCEFPRPSHVPRAGEGTVTVFGRRAFVMGDIGYGVVDLPAVGSTVTTSTFLFPAGTRAWPLSADRMLTWAGGEMSLRPVGVGAALATVNLAEPPVCSVLSPNGQLLATGDKEAVREWEAPSLTPVVTHPLEHPRALVYTPDNTRLHAVGRHHVAWEARQVPRLFEKHASFVSALDLPAAPRTEVVCRYLNGFMGVDPNTGLPFYDTGMRFGNHTAYVPGLHAAASNVDTLHHRTDVTEIRDVLTGRLRAKPFAHGDRVYGLGITGDARWLVAALDNRKIELWDLNTFVAGVLHTAPVALPAPCATGWRLDKRLQKVSGAITTFLQEGDIYRNVTPGASSWPMVEARRNAAALWSDFLQHYGSRGMPHLLAALPAPRDAFDGGAYLAFTICETLTWAVRKPNEDRRQAVAAVLRYARNARAFDDFSARINRTLGAIDDTLAPEPYLWAVISAFNAIEDLPDGDELSFWGFHAAGRNIPYPVD